MHYPWEGISIYRKECLSTLDFIIRDSNEMLALINVLNRKINDAYDNRGMKEFIATKFKMKLTYEAWLRSISVTSLIYYGILKTLQQKLAVSSYKLKAVVHNPTFNAQHRLFSENEDSVEVARDEPCKQRLRQHLDIIDYQLKVGFLNDFFKQERQKLIQRQVSYLMQTRIQTEDSLSPIESMETYGNMLYDFCHVRMALRNFRQ